MKYKFYRSRSGANRFNKKLLNRGDIFKKGSSGFTNCVVEAEKQGIQIKGDFVVRYSDQEKIKNVYDPSLTIFDDLKGEKNAKDHREDLEKIERETGQQRLFDEKTKDLDKKKTTWGGRREGAGRKSKDGIKRSKHSVYCSTEELEKIKKFLQEIRCI